MPKSKMPSKTGDTKLTITDGPSSFTFILRPAKVKIDYAVSGGELRAFPVARSDEAWFVLDKSGGYLGVVEEGAADAGSDGWGCLQFADRARHGAVPAAGLRLSAVLRTGDSWKDAIANSWWVKR